MLNLLFHLCTIILKSDLKTSFTFKPLFCLPFDSWHLLSISFNYTEGTLQQNPCEGGVLQQLWLGLQWNCDFLFSELNSAFRCTRGRAQSCTVPAEHFDGMEGGQSELGLLRMGMRLPKPWPCWSPRYPQPWPQRALPGCPQVPHVPLSWLGQAAVPGSRGRISS